MTRRVLLVGSLPFEDEASAMARAIELVGDRLLALPDGEIGERSDQYPSGDRSQWVAGLAGRLAREPSLFDVLDAGTMNEQGFPVDFDSTARLRPKIGPTKLGERLCLGYDTAALRSWPHFERLRSEVGLPGLRMQVGIPTGLGIAVSVLSTARALRYARAFAAGLEREATEIVRVIGAKNLLFQIEAPIEVIAAHRIPRPAAGLAAKPIVDLVRRLPSQTPVGVHLCYGDLNNIALIAPDNFDRLVGFANALIRRWPKSHTLAYVHLPFAAGASPPPTAPGAYRALRNLDLPADARLVAGFVHEQVPVERLEELLHIIEEARADEVDIACACGLGRRSTDTAEELMQRCRQLSGGSSATEQGD